RDWRGNPFLRSRDFDFEGHDFGNVLYNCAVLITRRRLLGGLAAVSASAVFDDLSFAQGPTSDLRIDAERLRQSLEGLSVNGRPAGGTFADGVSRVAYSDADVAGRSYAMQLMRGAELVPRIDAAGNIFGSRAGTGREL